MTLPGMRKTRDLASKTAVVNNMTAEVCLQDTEEFGYHEFAVHGLPQSLRGTDGTATTQCTRVRDSCSSVLRCLYDVRGRTLSHILTFGLSDIFVSTHCP